MKPDFYAQFSEEQLRRLTSILRGSQMGSGIDLLPGMSRTELVRCIEGETLDDQRIHQYEFGF